MGTVSGYSGQCHRRFETVMEELTSSLRIIFSMWFAHTAWHGRNKAFSLSIQF